MSDDSKLDFILDLDGESFIQTAEEALGKINSLGDAVLSIGTAAGFVGAAWLAAKASLDLTFEAESIKSVNAQFEILARQAGLVPQTLKEGLDKSSDGLIQETELLKIANDAMIRFGSSSAKLPEVMELARRISVATGKDLAQTFEQLSQGIISGQTRALKSLGIYVDTEQAVRRFAEANGVAVNALSDAGRRQAILNAALQDGESRYASTNTSIKQTTESWTRMKNAVSDLYDTIALGFNSIFGPTVKKMVDSFAGLADAAKKVGLTIFGDETQKAQIHLEAYSGSLKTAQGYLDMFQTKLAQTKDPVEIQRITSEIEFQKQRIAEAQAQIDKYKSVVETASTANVAAGSSGSTKASVQEDITNKDKLKENEISFNKEISNLRDQRLKSEEQNAISIEQVNKQADQERLQETQKLAAQMAQIENNPNLNRDQKNKEEEEISRQSAARQIAIDDDLNKKRTQALDRYTERAKSDADGIARGFEAGSKKAQIAQQDFGAVGTRVFKSFETNAVSALEAFGAGQQSASEAAKGFIFGMLADEAEARGKIILLASIWPPNPAGLAAGAGLIALSGFLRSQASTSGSLGGGDSGGGSSGGGAPAASSSPSDVSNFQQSKPTQTVSINIQGNYYDTTQTRQALVQMIRDEADGSDFTIQGGS